MEFDAAFWHHLFPHAHPDLLQAWIDQGNDVLHAALVDDGRLKCGLFLGQIGHESGGLTIHEEDLNYRAARLVQVWPSRFPSLRNAAPFEHNPKLLAEHVYGGRMGNGPEGSGDGWRYRGQGPIQITGHDDYDAVGKFCNIDLVHYPEQAGEARNGPMTALGFWTWKKITEAIGRCASQEEALVVSTKLINGGLIGLSDRREWLNRALKLIDSVAQAPESPPSLGDVVVRNGSKGAAVEKLQRLLNARAGTSLRPDGKAGPATIAAVIAWQEQRGLVDDGVCGSSTWLSLEAA